MSDLFLHPIREERVYCGPAALISLTGADKATVRAWLNTLRGRPHKVGIFGVSCEEMKIMISLLGYKVEKIMVNKAQSILDFALANPQGYHVVCAACHYVTIAAGVIQDINARFGAPPHEHPWRRKRVVYALRVTAPARPGIIQLPDIGQLEAMVRSAERAVTDFMDNVA